MLKVIGSLMIAGIAIIASCNDSNTTTMTSSSPSEGSFGYDLAFLKQHDEPVVLTSGDASVIVSPKYQGKVFTSTASGDSGTSFGWVNYKAFGKSDEHMHAYGGENRLWLGPEGGKFSIFFKPGTKMEFANWKTPADYDTASWDVDAKDGISVTMHKDMALQNYAGTNLSLKIDRKVEIIERAQIFSNLQLTNDDSLHIVGYTTHNTLSNTGKEGWTETTGMPCIWMLDMFKPSPQTVILVPFSNPAKDAVSKVATTNYFGEIPADRLKFTDSILFLKADGKSRGKIGIHPTSSKPFAGSYDALHKVLTITMFDTNPTAKFLNQEWRTDRAPFSGDAVNAYNDGPLADGSQMGPFYELESVSPAAFLQPGQSLQHTHAVFHFTGPEASLDVVAKKLLGIYLNDINKMFSHE